MKITRLRKLQVKMLRTILKYNDNMNIIKNIPIPISGLILALLSLGNLLQDIHPYLRYLFGSLGVIFLILIILKVILYPDDIKKTLKIP